MEQVKAELGSDAVILHTKKYKDGGVFGLGSQEIVEVTAAIEEEPAGRKASKSAVPPAPQPAAYPAASVLPSSVLAQYKTNGTAEGVAMASRRNDEPLSVDLPQFPILDNKQAPAHTSRIIKANPTVAQEKFPTPEELMWEAARQSKRQPEEAVPERLVHEPFQQNQPLPEESVLKRSVREPVRQVPPEPEEQPVRETLRQNKQRTEEPETEYYEDDEIDVSEPPKRRKRKAEPPEDNEDLQKIRQLEDELAKMKTLLAQVMSTNAPENVVSLQEALHDQDVDDEILKDMAAHSGAGETLADKKSPEAGRTLSKYLQQVVKCSDGIQLNRHGARIVALIGATGVGKTTTLAKIAARFVLDQGVKAALITADTYRISAVEQLRTYSDIIGLPLEIVYTPAELSKAIRKHRTKDLILIDTAGRSQYNDYQMKELQDFLKVNSHIEKHLVMSATTKRKDAEQILEKFSVCEPERVIFTKTDETSSVGLILNLLYDRQLSLSYLTNGQSVPDDIVSASTEKLAELLLRD